MTEIKILPDISNQSASLDHYRNNNWIWIQNCFTHDVLPPIPTRRCHASSDLLLTFDQRTRSVSCMYRARNRRVYSTSHMDTIEWDKNLQETWASCKLSINTTQDNRIIVTKHNCQTIQRSSDFQGCTGTGYWLHSRLCLYVIASA